MFSVVKDWEPGFLEEFPLPWEEWMTRPYPHYGPLSKTGNLASLWTVRYRAMLSRNQALVCIRGKERLGIALFRERPWDSEQLGRRSASIEMLASGGPYSVQCEVKRKLVEEILRESGRKGLSYLVCRVGAKDLSGIHTLERMGFVQVDSLLTFSLEIRTRSIPQDPLLQWRYARPEDIPTLAETAKASYVYDRFHTDPVIPKERADALHGEWISNCVRKKVADEVVVALEGGEPVGFVACRLDREAGEHLGEPVGTIVLVATHPSRQRRGLAQRMTAASLSWFKQAGARWVEVGTQLRNLPASRLYMKCGFMLVESSVTFRYIPGGES